MVYKGAPKCVSKCPSIVSKKMITHEGTNVRYLSTVQQNVWSVGN